MVFKKMNTAGPYNLRGKKGTKQAKTPTNLNNPKSTPAHQQATATSVSTKRSNVSGGGSNVAAVNAGPVSNIKPTSRSTTDSEIECFQSHFPSKTPKAALYSEDDDHNDDDYSRVESSIGSMTHKAMVSRGEDGYISTYNQQQPTQQLQQKPRRASLVYSVDGHELMHIESEADEEDGDGGEYYVDEALAPSASMQKESSATLSSLSHWSATEEAVTRSSTTCFKWVKTQL